MKLLDKIRGLLHPEEEPEMAQEDPSAMDGTVGWGAGKELIRRAGLRITSCKKLEYQYGQYNSRKIYPEDITGSSRLDQPQDFSPGRVMDLNPKTCWQEAADNNGIGSWLDFFIPKGTPVWGIQLYPGSMADKLNFEGNTTPTRLMIYTQTECILWDYADIIPKEFETAFTLIANLTTPFTSDGQIRVKIMDVRDGTLFGDCCISEMWFLSEIIKK